MGEDKEDGTDWIRKFHSDMVAFKLWSFKKLPNKVQKIWNLVFPE